MNISESEPFYHSLSSAVNTFGLSTNEIIDLAIKGEIILSVEISNLYIPYLMSTIEPEESKKFGALIYSNDALKDTSMLPEEWMLITHLNLSIDDCKLLKRSNLKQSVFESVFHQPINQNSGHILIHIKNDWINGVTLNFDNDWINGLKLNFYNDRINDVKLDFDNGDLEEKFNNLTPENKKRFVNGVHSQKSGRSLRKFVLIDHRVEVETTVGIEFIAGSRLHQACAKELKITQNDIEISSNYTNVFNSVTGIPESSPYFVKPELKDFNSLYALAEVGYQYSIRAEKDCSKALKKFINDQVNYIRYSKKTIDAIVFFLSLKPSHNAGLHKLTPSKGCKCQFKFLLNESEKYWFDKCLDPHLVVDKHRIGFAEQLRESGYSNEKAIHGEFLSLPNNINEGARVLNINKVFPSIKE